MRGPVEGSQFEPLLQRGEHFFGVRRKASHEMLEHGGVAHAKAAPLRGEPAIELHAAIDLEPVQKVAGEEC